MGSRLVLALSFLMLGAVFPHASDAALRVQIVNQSGQPSDGVYVMLSGGSSSDGQLRNNVPVKLSAIDNKRFSLSSFGGRIYFSYGSPVAFNEPNRSPTRYDKVELTYPGVANLTAVDFFGIPFKLQTQDAGGNAISTLNYDAYTSTIKRALLDIPGTNSALVKTKSGGFARILSPQLSQSSYPSLTRYIDSMDGQTVTLRGAFFGTPYQTFSYSGKFASDGTITLNGQITPKDGSPAPGAQVTVAGASLPSAIYTVDGPYTWGGRVHHVSDNDVYAVIYRDLLSGFAWGYWGGKYGNDSANWLRKPPFAKARVKPAGYSTYNEYAAVIYKYSDAYGFSFSDTGPKDVQLSLTNAPTLQITILPDQKSGKARCKTGSNRCSD